MWTRVKVTQKPSKQPLTLSALKSRVRVDFQADDTLLLNYLNGAVARIDGPAGIGYALMDQEWQWSLDAFPAVLCLPGAPVTSVTSIQYYDVDGVLQTVPPADYRVDLGGDTARVEAVNGWPATASRFGAVLVSYRLGAAESSGVPDDLIDAISLLVAHRYEIRQAAVNGVLTLVPLGFDSIVSEYRRPAVSA